MGQEIFFLPADQEKKAQIALLMIKVNQQGSIRVIRNESSLLALIVVNNPEIQKVLKENSTIKNAATKNKIVQDLLNAIDQKNNEKVIEIVKSQAQFIENILTTDEKLNQDILNTLLYKLR